MYIYTGENGIYQLGVNFDNIAKIGVMRSKVRLKNFDI